MRAKRSVNHGAIVEKRTGKTSWAGKISGYAFTFSPSCLDEPLLRELWQFRATHVGLKPGVDPEEDFVSFSRTIHKGSLSLVRRDQTGAVRGMSHFSEQTYVYNGRPFVLIQPEYVFFDQGFHKELGAPIATIWTIIRACILWPAHRIYIGGPVYLGGFMTVCQLTKPVWLWGDKDMPQWERGAFSLVASKIGGWEPAAGIVNMKTFILQPRMKPPRITRLSKDAIRYTSISPKWYEGYTPFCFARLHILSVAMIARSFFMRLKI
ncbi:MAG: hypothetical protein MUP22_04780 [Desulfobacterales bacterium]|nr:hypothetical protein [Desulfobacterales bacterium]